MITFFYGSSLQSIALFDEEGLPTPPEQRTVVVVAHSNTIRSLMAFIDKVPPDAIPKLHVPNSVTAGLR